MQSNGVMPFSGKFLHELGGEFYSRASRYVVSRGPVAFFERIVLVKSVN